MIPKQNKTPRMEQLQNLVAALPGGLAGLDHLTLGDHQLIGAYIQLFNFIELNLRRSVDVFAQAKLLAPAIAKRHRKLASSELVPALKQGVSGMDGAMENIPSAVAKLDEIELRRSFRNLLGHWAARRIPGEDAILLVTKDARDERQVSSQDGLEGDDVTTAIMDLADLRGLLEHMGDYDLWIAEKTAEWFGRYVVLPR